MLLALWIAWGDLRTRRIPNYLTLGTALAGLAYGFICQGWTGLSNGFWGMLVGFGFLLVPYLWGGLGAGDVKALAALGAWLGPKLTVLLFCYMGVAGGLMALVVLWRKGLLGAKVRQGWVWLVNQILCRGQGLASENAPIAKIEGIPYGVAMAVGMVLLLGTEV